MPQSDPEMFPAKSASVPQPSTPSNQHSVPPPAIPDHELLRRIGGGSYGEVWLARSVMGTYRAVKIVHRHSFEHDRPFEREFEGIQKFEPISRSHEGFVDLLQVGRNDAEGYFYYVMELADDAGENPKLEIRNPKEIRSSKSQTDAEAALLRTSGFVLPSEFGLRNSDLYVPRTLRSLLRPDTQHSTPIIREPALNPRPTTNRLPLDECIQLGLSLTSALAYLHK
ncbi:MAG: hypothetical protein HY298_13510 [Verrucomicrobia bacterium]|nr:hypothetical protein [Verrucomicrobiota bacterium]